MKIDRQKYKENSAWFDGYQAARKEIESDKQNNENMEVFLAFIGALYCDMVRLREMSPPSNMIQAHERLEKIEKKLEQALGSIRIADEPVVDWDEQPTLLDKAKQLLNETQNENS